MNEIIKGPVLKETPFLDRLRKACRPPEEKDKLFISRETRHILDITISVKDGEEELSANGELLPKAHACYGSDEPGEKLLPQPSSFDNSRFASQINLLDTVINLHGEIPSDSPEGKRPLDMYFPFHIASINIGTNTEGNPYFAAVDQDEQGVIIPLPKNETSVELISTLKALQSIDPKSPAKKHSTLNASLRAARLEALSRSFLVHRARELISQGVPVKDLPDLLK